VKVYLRDQLIKTHPRRQPGGRSTDVADMPWEPAVDVVSSGFEEIPDADAEAQLPEQELRQFRGPLTRACRELAPQLARMHGPNASERLAAVRFVPLSKRGRDLISAWLDERGRHLGPAWPGQRDPRSVSGITQVVLAAGADAGIPGLCPNRCRHTFGTRLRQGGADPAQVQALLGHASVDTAARYFNSRELHQPGEKPQVSRSRQGRDSVPRLWTAAV